MTTRAGVRNLVKICHLRRDELKRVTAYVDIRDRLLDSRHVARDALASRALGPMMLVCLNRGGMRAVRR